MHQNTKKKLFRLDQGLLKIKQQHQSSSKESESNNAVNINAIERSRRELLVYRGITKLLISERFIFIRNIIAIKYRDTFLCRKLS